MGLQVLLGNELGLLKSPGCLTKSGSATRKYNIQIPDIFEVCWNDVNWKAPPSDVENSSENVGCLEPCAHLLPGTIAILPLRKGINEREGVGGGCSFSSSLSAPFPLSLIILSCLFNSIYLKAFIPVHLVLKWIKCPLSYDPCFSRE